MAKLLVDNDLLVSSWAYGTFNIYPLPVNKAFGVLDKQNNIIGAVLFQNYNGVNVELSVYGQEYFLTSGVIRKIAGIVLTDFNAGRLTVVTSRRNRRLIRSLLKLGFVIEGMMRCFYGHEDNKKNTGIRLAVFRSRLEEVAYKKKNTKNHAIQN